MTPWPKLLVDLIEDGSTTVTYLNYACSGALVGQLATDSYDGMNPRPHRLKPQISRLRDALGPPLAPSTRTVNLLLASSGINELGGSGIADLLVACIPTSEIARAVGLLVNPTLALNAFLLELEVDCRQDLSGDLKRLPRLYDTVELAASARLKLGHMHVIGYPARVFTDEDNDFGGCGLVFGDIDDDEARWVTASLNELDRQIAQAALRNGWSFTATTGIFTPGAGRRHGYCSDEPWFHTPTSSVKRQGDVNGTMHPTKSGQRATATRVRSTVLLDESPPAPARLRVHFLRARVRHRGPLSDWPGKLELGVSLHRSPCGKTAPALPVTLNHWKDVSANRCLDYDFTTVGRTIGVTGLTRLGPRVPFVPRKTVSARRLHRRHNGWNATSQGGPACVLQHAVGRASGRNPVVIELDYEIATSGPLGPAPCAPVPRPGKRSAASLR